MSEQSQSGPSAETVEEILRGELAHGDVMLATAPPILRHMLANGDHALFSDEVIAKVRGSMMHLARQMLFAVADKAGIADRGAFAAERQDAIAHAMLNDTDFLAYAHALTLEAQIAERLEVRSGIDPVLSPLLQELAASSEQHTAAAAMQALAAQARFMQHTRRMELPLGELPESLFDSALRMLGEQASDMAHAAASAGQTMTEARSAGQPRVRKLEKLVSGMGSKAKRALEIDNAGVSMFVTALAMASDQPRETAILSLGENQCARLALALRAAGLGQGAVEEQFLYLHPDIALPEGFDKLRADRAAALLANSANETAH